MRPHSIRTSLVLWFAGLAFFLLSVFAGTLFYSIKNTLEKGLDASLENTATWLVALCEHEQNIDYDRSGPDPELEPPLPDPSECSIEFDYPAELSHQIEERNPRRSEEVWEWPPWKRLHHSGPPIETTLPQDTFENWPKSSKSAGSTPIRDFKTIEGEATHRRLGTFLFRTPAVDATDDDPAMPGFTVLVRVEEDLKSIDEQLAEISWIAIVLAFLCGFVALLFAIVFSRRIIRPLHQLGVAADKVKAGHKVDLPDKGVGDELDELSRVLKEAFVRLEESADRQARFTADAAHELRNPIAVIQSTAEISLRRERTGDQYREFMSDIFVTSKRMSRVLEALLFLARLDAGKKNALSDPVDVAALARESAHCHPNGENRVHVVAHEAAYVHGDAALISVLIDNLISNALRYSAPSTQVSVEIQHGENVQLRILDQGPGIPDDAVSRVFDRFYRAPNTAPKTEGAGLGLSIVAEVARVHHARLQVETSPSGTSVTVEFPFVPAA